jgi:hypothetical protein
MNRMSGFTLSTALVLAPALAVGDDVSDLRKEITAIKNAYEARIEALEQKLKTLEAQQATRSAPAEPAATEARAPAPAGREAQRTGAVSAGSAFNPQLSVILNGVYYSDNQGGNGAGMAGDVAGIFHGHGHDGHDHGGLEQGFNLQETEIAFSATVDPYFDAATYLAISSDGDVELEEAYLQTRSLPAGLRVKAGKFLSDIGYANSRHPHQWDFTDQNLPYLAVFGDHGLTDTGVQLTWLPELPVYTLFGVEASQSKDLERIGATVDDHDQEHYEEELGVDSIGLGRKKQGPQFYTAFAKVAPDLGADHALQVGAWYAYFRQHQEVDEHDGLTRAFEGDARAWGLDAVYKYDSGLSHGQGDWKLQAEYLRANKDLDLTFSSAGAADGSLRGTQDGLYLQGWYGFAPRWRAGLRYDTTGLANRLRGVESENLDRSDRWTAAVTWALSEYSLLRLQLATADLAYQDGGDERVNSVYLQYVLSLGAHGAHKF